MPDPYITSESVTFDSTTVTFTFLYYGDYIFYRTYDNLTNVWSSYTSMGSSNFYHFTYNGLSRSFTFSRSSDHSYFQTVHCRMFDIHTTYSYYDNYFRSYYQSIYIPQKQYAFITDDKMFYKTFTGKDTTTDVYLSGVSNGNIIYQSNLSHLYSNASVGNIIDSTKSKNWFTSQHSTSYIQSGHYQINPSYSSSLYWPW